MPREKSPFLTFQTIMSSNRFASSTCWTFTDTCPSSRVFERNLLAFKEFRWYRGLVNVNFYAYKSIAVRKIIEALRTALAKKWGDSVSNNFVPRLSRLPVVMALIHETFFHAIHYGYMLCYWYICFVSRILMRNNTWKGRVGGGRFALELKAEL